MRSAAKRQEWTRIVPDSRLSWLVSMADDAERMGQVEMTLEELRLVLSELQARRNAVSSDSLPTKPDPHLISEWVQW